MKTKVMEVITYKKQTSETKYIIEAAFEYMPPLNISRNFFSEKENKSRGFYSRKYGTLNKKSQSKRNFRTFEWFGENSPNSSCHI